MFLWVVQSSVVVLFELVCVASVTMCCVFSQPDTPTERDNTSERERVKKLVCLSMCTAFIPRQGIYIEFTENSIISSPPPLCLVS